MNFIIIIINVSRGSGVHNASRCEFPCGPSLKE